MQLDLFTVDYLILDEFGTKEILCLGCGVPVKSRMEIRSQKFSGQIIRELSSHNNYKEIPFIRENGSISFIMVCSDCVQIEITPEHICKIIEQIKSALKKQFIWEGKEEFLVDEIIKEKFSPILRKAEVQEVTKAMRSV